MGKYCRWFIYKIKFCCPLQHLYVLLKKGDNISRYFHNNASLQVLENELILVV